MGRPKKKNGIEHPQPRVTVVREEEGDTDVLVGLVEDANSLRSVSIIQRTRLAAFVDHFQKVQRLRVSLDIAKAHLEIHSRRDPLTEALRKRVWPVEEWAADQLKELVMNHPTYKWWGRIHGISFVSMAQILGIIEGFGRFYEKDHFMIPASLIGGERAPMTVQLFDRDGNPTEQKDMVWVEGIERFTMPSKLRKFAGLVPGQRLEKGRVASYATNLKGALYRLATFSLLMKKKKYFQFFEAYREQKRTTLQANGVRILPTPKGKFCATCEEEKQVLKARFCPDCESPLTAKTEPEGIIWKQHFFLMCVVRVESLFLNHLWQVWRKEVGLPVVDPYPFTSFGGNHEVDSYIDAWKMVDYDQPQEPKFKFDRTEYMQSINEIMQLPPPQPNQQYADA